MQLTFFTTFRRVKLSHVKKIGRSKKVKKRNKIVALMMCIATIFISLPADNRVENIDYEIQQVIEEQNALSIQVLNDYLTPDAHKIRIKVMYEKGYKPPVTFYYTAIKNGVKHEGNLDIVSISNTKDATYAIYSGYIYPAE